MSEYVVILLPIVTTAIAVLGGVWGYNIQRKHALEMANRDRLATVYSEYISSVSKHLFEAPIRSGADLEGIVFQHQERSALLQVVAPHQICRSAMKLDKELMLHTMNAIGGSLTDEVKRSVLESRANLLADMRKSINVESLK